MLLHASAHPAPRRESNSPSEGLHQCACTRTGARNKKKKRGEKKHELAQHCSYTSAPCPACTRARPRGDTGVPHVGPPAPGGSGHLVARAEARGPPRTSEGGLQGPREVDGYRSTRGRWGHKAPPSRGGDSTTASCPGAAPWSQPPQESHIQNPPQHPFLAP